LKELPAELVQLQDLQELHFDNNPLQGYLENLSIHPAAKSGFVNKQLRSAPRNGVNWTWQKADPKTDETPALLDKMPDQRVEQLRNEIGAFDQFNKNAANQTIFEIDKHASDIWDPIQLFVLVRTFAHSVHLEPPEINEQSWSLQEIEGWLARQILIHILTTELAYHTPKMERERATVLAEQSSVSLLQTSLLYQLSFLHSITFR